MMRFKEIVLFSAIVLFHGACQINSLQRTVGINNLHEAPIMSSESTITLTYEGSSKWKLFIPENAGDVERFAAEELIHYTRKISDATIMITDNNAAYPLIILGLRRNIKDAENLPEPQPGFDGYSIVISGKNIIIAGENSRGVLYGVYDFLEKAGCRWYYPFLDDKDPEVIPHKKDIILQVSSWAESAAIEDRFYWVSGLAFKIVPGHVKPQIDWAMKNRYNGLSWQCVIDSIDKDLGQMKSDGIFDEISKRDMRLHGPGHSFPYFLPAERYFNDHPEWFGFKNGKRNSNDKIWPALNFCMSNPEAVEQFIKNVELFVQRYPQITHLDILTADGAVACECDACKKIGATNLMIDLFNKLSERIEKISANVILDFVPGYGILENVPDTTFPNGKWQAVYAHWGRNHAHSYNDPDYSRRQNLLVWRSYFPRFMVCSYYAANSHQPFFGPPYFHALKGDLDFYVKQKITGAFVLEYPFGFWWNNAYNVRMGGLFSYYYPNRDPKSEIQDFAYHYYGQEAASLMIEFYTMLGDDKNLERSYRASRGEGDEGDVRFFQEMLTLLYRVRQMVDGDPIFSYRISKLIACFEMVSFLCPTRNKIIEVEKSINNVDPAKADIAEIKKNITECRQMIDAILMKGEQLENEYPGIMSYEWLKNWVINRTYTGPLDRAEQTLAGISASDVDSKPDHAVDTDL